MGNNLPRISMSAEDVIKACQSLVSQKATLCHEAGKDSAYGPETARVCYEQYVEGVTAVMDLLGPGRLGDTMRTFAQYKAQMLKGEPDTH